MENFNIIKGTSGFEIQGLPPGTELVKIDGQDAQRLGQLALHRADLAFAANCLAELGPCDASPNTLQLALWRCAIVHFLKCFQQSESRFRLNEKTVYKGQDPLALENFNYFVSFRNKHLVHDENAFAQAIPMAALSAAGTTYKIEKILCFCAIADVLSAESYNSLRRLVELARTWVEAESDRYCGMLTRTLEAESRESLRALERVAYQKPTVADMYTKRKP